MEYMEAKGLLKSFGLSVGDLSDCLGIQTNSLYRRWQNGLNVSEVLLLKGYIAEKSGELDRLIEIKACPIRGRVYDALV